MKISFAKLLSIIAIVLSLPFILCSCNTFNPDVDKTFEEDYTKLQRVADYLYSCNYSTIVINNANTPMGVYPGEDTVIDNKETKKIVSELFDKGYIQIVKYHETVKFIRWKKSFSGEFRAGFAVNSSGTDLDIQYLIKQEGLSIPCWYYYEEDYNEWRVNKTD